jgi:hypothetical protein
LGALHEMYRRYENQVAFFVVYIKEAHPDDGWVSQGNLDDGIHLYDPTSDEERVEVAQTCAVGLHIEMPVLIDGIDNSVASAYGALPDRLYLVGRDGRIAFQGDRGPQGLVAEALDAAIQNELHLIEP